VAKSCTIHSRRPVRKIWIHPRVCVCVCWYEQ